MRLEWKLKRFSAYFACIDKYFSGICDLCVDNIVFDLGSFTYTGFYDSSLLKNTVVRDSIWFHVNSELDSG